MHGTRTVTGVRAIIRNLTVVRRGIVVIAAAVAAAFVVAAVATILAVAAALAILAVAAAATFAVATVLAVATAAASAPPGEVAAELHPGWLAVTGSRCVCNLHRQSNIKRTGETQVNERGFRIYERHCVDAKYRPPSSVGYVLHNPKKITCEMVETCDLHQLFHVPEVVSVTVVPASMYASFMHTEVHRRMRSLVRALRDMRCPRALRGSACYICSGTSRCIF